MSFSKQEKQIQEFWNYFTLHHEKFCSLNSIASFSKDEHICNLRKLLKQIDENLIFEVGSCTEGRGELTLSADGIETAFPYIDEIYRSKPKLSNWIVHKFRQPMLNIEDFSINIDDIEVQFCEVFFKLTEKKEGIIVSLFIPGYKEDSLMYEATKFIILDLCLGEYDAVKKVMYCASYNLNDNKDLALKPIKLLKEDFDTMYRSKMN